MKQKRSIERVSGPRQKISVQRPVTVPWEKDNGPLGSIRGLDFPDQFGMSNGKNPQHAFLGGEVKPSPMSQICAACQRTVGLRGSRNHRQN